MSDVGDHTGTRRDLIEGLLPPSRETVFKAEDLAAECLTAMAEDDRAQPSLNAIRNLVPHALDRARMLDRVAPGSRGRLHGIPIVLKDNIDVLGMPTTSGCRALAGAMPWRDATVVGLLSEAGAVVLAKTNLSEFSFEIRSRSSLGGDVLNPFNRAVTAGGSSGGAAAAVSAGFAMAAVGTDTGGSIRTPAAFNGLVGLRPTHRAIDRTGVAPLAPSTDTVGGLTRSVRDAARLLSVLTGAVDDPGSEFGHLHFERLAGVRFGVCRQAFGSDPQIIRAMHGALATLSAAGVTVIDPAELPIAVLDFDGEHIVDLEFRPAFDAYLATNFRSGAPGSLADILSSGDFLPGYRDTLIRRAAVEDLQSDAHREVLERHARLRRVLLDIFDSARLDALIYPTAANVPVSLDNPVGGWAPELAACSGWPAITLPVGQASNGVPIGLEMLGRPHAERHLLGLAAQLERLVGKTFRPPRQPGLDARSRAGTAR